tara:strand:+ start:3190 stop:5022 length:1833 start_codon:yes stop_codon:yes gene_type:complete
MKLLYDIQQLQKKVNNYYSNEETNIERIKKTLKTKINIVPLELQYKFKTGHEEVNSFINLIKNTTITKSIKHLNIDIPDNKKFIYYFSILNDVKSISELIILNKNISLKTYEYLFNHEEIVNIIIYYEEIYKKIILEISNIYYLDKEDTKKNKLFYTLSTILNIDDNFKDNKDYILDKFISYNNKFKESGFIEKLNNIEDQNNNFLVISNELKTMKNTLTELYSKKSIIFDNIEGKLKKEQIQYNEKKKKNIMKKFNKYLSSTNSLDNLKILLEEKKKKLLILTINVEELENPNCYYGIELKQLYIEKELLNKKITILGSKDIYINKLSIVKNNILKKEEEIYVDKLLTKNKINKNKEAIQLLNNDIKLLENEKCELQILEDKFEYKNYEKIINLEYNKYNKIKLQINDLESYIINKKKLCYKKNLKLKTEKFFFLKKNTQKVINYNNIDKIKESINTYLKILEKEKENKIKFNKKINDLDFNTINIHIKNIKLPEQKFIITNKYLEEINKELKNIILWKTNIYIQKKLLLMYSGGVNESLIYILKNKNFNKINLMKKLNIIKLKEKDNINHLFSQLKISNLNKNNLELIKINLNELEMEINILKKFTYD